MVTVLRKTSVSHLKWFKKASQQDLPDSQYMLGLVLPSGQGGGVWIMSLPNTGFTKRQFKNYANAQFMYAYMLQAGDGGESEPIKALIWSELARRNGKTDASDISNLSKLLVDDDELAKGACSRPSVPRIKLPTMSKITSSVCVPGK